MNLWIEREKSSSWIKNELHQEGKILQNGFDYIEMILNVFQKISDNEGESQAGQFSRICLVTLAKFCYLLLGIYDLMLNALAQESGALLRPLIETYELLVYFRQDITRINEVLEGKLPSAGEIAKEISGDFKDLREYLNENASHFSYKTGSLQHLFNQEIKITPTPTQSRKVFIKNIALLNAFQIFMLTESVSCLFSIGFDANLLADEIEKWIDNSIKIFPLKN